MSRQPLGSESESRTYQIRLIGEDGATKLSYDTACRDDDEAIDKLFEIKDIPYARFEIVCDGQTISQGSYQIRG